jgi:hypothetical protein
LKTKLLQSQDSSSKNEEHTMNTDSIRFPAEYDPSRCPVHVVNTIDISASPAEVWEHLITAADWQTWQPALSNIRIQDGSRKLSQDVKEPASSCRHLA